MASEMVERVARKFRELRQCDAPGFPCPFCHWTEVSGDETGCFTLARAAIEAMRDPTEAMEAAMYADLFRDVWQAMIDKALEE